jgi:hypothetical protein
MNWKSIDPSSKDPIDLKVACVWYVATEGVQMISLVADLLNRAVIDAQADVASALSITGIQDALVANKFESGSKPLQFYSFNFRIPSMTECQMRFLFP